MHQFIPYGKQSITQQDIDGVVAVLQSDFITQGPALGAFETALASYTKSHHAVAVSSATAALHLACLALDVKPGDEVWTVPNTFVASANCARYCGAKIDFIDIDIETGRLSVEALSEKLKAAIKLPKVIIPVHFAGASCDMEEIAKLASQYGFKVIEDASHSIGGRYLDAPVGNCQFSDVCIFSFHPVKIITTGEGGALTTNDASLAKRLTQLRSHGITRDSEQFKETPHGPWYYEQHMLGFNYRLTDIQAALGLSQLKRLDEFVRTRHSLVDHYLEVLRPLSTIQPLQVSGNVYSSHHLFVVQVPSNLRAHLYNALRAANIGANVHYIPVHIQPDYQTLGFRAGDFPNSERYYSQAITLPLHPGMTPEDIVYIGSCLATALNEV